MGRRGWLVSLVVGVTVAVALAAFLLRPADRKESTLAEFFFTESGSPAGQRELEFREALAVQRLIARCMAIRGFTYLPYVPQPPTIVDPDLPPLDWAEKWGFGLTTTALIEQPVVVDQDPNIARLASLPPAEATEYRTALLGPGTGASATSGSEGCQQQANELVYRRRERAAGPLEASLQALQVAIGADPDLVAANEQWAGCVNVALGRTSGDPNANLEAGKSALLAELDDVVGYPPRADYDREDLASLQTRERELAVAVARCHEALLAVQQNVTARHEAAFIESHRAELDAARQRLREEELALGIIEPSPSPPG